MHLLDKWGIEGEPLGLKTSLVPALFDPEDDDASKRIVALTENRTEEASKRQEEKKKKQKPLDWSKVKAPTNPMALRAVEEF